MNRRSGLDHWTLFYLLLWRCLALLRFGLFWMSTIQTLMVAYNRDALAVGFFLLYRPEMRALGDWSSHWKKVVG